MKQNKKRFWHSETFWDYVVPIIVGVIISTLTTLAFNWLVGGQLMKQSHIDVAVVFYKGNRRMTKAELEQLKKSNPTKAELDEISVKLKQSD